MMVNGVENPCAKCGKAMKEEKHFVPCVTLDECHGKDCECFLAVGPTCYKKIMKEWKH